MDTRIFAEKKIEGEKVIIIIPYSATAATDITEEKHRVCYGNGMIVSEGRGGKRV